MHERVSERVLTEKKKKLTFAAKSYYLNLYMSLYFKGEKSNFYSASLKSRFKVKIHQDPEKRCF